MLLRLSIPINITADLQNLAKQTSPFLCLSNEAIIQQGFGGLDTEAQWKQTIPFIYLFIFLFYLFYISRTEIIGKEKLDFHDELSYAINMTNNCDKIVRGKSDAACRLVKASESFWQVKGHTKCALPYLECQMKNHDASSSVLNLKIYNVWDYKKKCSLFRIVAM